LEEQSQNTFLLTNRQKYILFERKSLNECNEHKQLFITIFLNAQFL